MITFLTTLVTLAATAVGEGTELLAAENENSKNVVFNSELVHPVVTTFPTSRRLDQQCRDILTGVVALVPNAEQVCDCNESNAVVCQFVDRCNVLGNAICAERIDVTLDLNEIDTLFVGYCSTFKDFFYARTCIVVGLTTDGQKVNSCEKAVYGNDGSGNINDGDCPCSVCDDGFGIHIDCSRYHPLAFTDGCQYLDLSHNELIPFIPDFQSYDTNEDRSDITIIGEQIPIIEGERILTQQVVVLKCNHTIPENKNCPVLPIFEEKIYQNASQVCGCVDLTTLRCAYEGICAYTDMSVKTDVGRDSPCSQTAVQVTIEWHGEGARMTYCNDYADYYQSTWTDINLELDGKIKNCQSTYGGKDCLCNVCDDNPYGLSIDCTSYNTLATTNGCQVLPNLVGSVVVPTFHPPPRVQSCALFSFLKTQLPNAEANCACENQQGTRIVCQLQDFCSHNNLKSSGYRDTCASVESVDLIVDALGGLSTKSCTKFANETSLEVTCVNVDMDLGHRLVACNNATYGGRLCDCSICGGNGNNVGGQEINSLSIDCSEFHPLATTNGCQILTIENQIAALGPIIPEFDINGIGNGDRSKNGVDNDCSLFQVFAPSLPINNSDICVCDSRSELQCTFNNICGTEDSHLLSCVSSLDLTLNLSSGATVQSCMNYTTNYGKYEEMCMDISEKLLFGRSIISCNNVTYGGKPCECIVCDDRSLIIDCALVDSRVTTNFCQNYRHVSFEGQPFVPALDIVSSDSLNYQKSCALMNLLDARNLDDLENVCLCNASNNATKTTMNCRRENVCSTQKTTCSDHVDTSITTLSGGIQFLVDNCFKIRSDHSEQFEEICILVEMGRRETSLSPLLSTTPFLELQRCVNVLYAGNLCNECRLCQDKKSIEFDCSEYNSRAMTSECEDISQMEQLRPVVPNLMKQEDSLSLNINSNIDTNDSNYNRNTSDGTAARGLINVLRVQIVIIILSSFFFF